MYSMGACPTKDSISISLIFQNPSLFCFWWFALGFFFTYPTSVSISAALALCVKKHTELHA